MVATLSLSLLVGLSASAPQIAVDIAPISPVHAALYTPEGDRVVTLMHQGACLWDVQTAHKIHCVGLEHAFRAAAITQDDRLIAIDETGLLEIDLRTGAHTPPTPLNLPAGPLSLRIDPLGQHLAVWSGRKATWWSIDQARSGAKGTSRRAPRRITDVSFVPGRRVAIATERSVHMHRRSDGRRLWRKFAPPGLRFCGVYMEQLYGVSVELFAYRLKDGKPTIYRVATSQAALLRGRVHKDRFQGVGTFSERPAFLEGKLRRTQRRTEIVLSKTSILPQLSALGAKDALSPSGNSILVPKRGDDLRPVLLKPNAQEIRLGSAALKLHDLVFSPDGGSLWLAHSQGASQWELRAPQRMHKLPTEGRALLRLAFNPKGTRLVALAAEGAQLWDPIGRLLKSLGTVPGAPAGLWVSADEAVLTTDSRMVRIALTTGKITEKTALEKSSVAAWSFDRGLATARRETVHHRLELGRHFAPINALRYQGDQLISASEDNTVRLWDLKAKAEKKICYGHRYPVKRLVSDKARIVSVDAKNHIRIWSSQCDPQSSLQIHSGAPIGLALHPSGKLLAIAEPQKVTLWDLKTALQIAALTPISASDFAVITTEGKLAASSGAMPKMSLKEGARLLRSTTVKERLDPDAVAERLRPYLQP